MSIQKVNLREKFNLIEDHWNPRIAGELNSQHVKLVKLQGEFTWHSHEKEDEMFLVIKGELAIHLRDHIHYLKAGEFIIIPKGVEHKPVAEKETEIMLFEPVSTVNTGDKESEFTRTKLLKI